MTVFFPFIQVAVSEDEDSKQLILPVVHVAFTRFRLKSVVFCFDIFVLFIVYICEKGSKAMLSGSEHVSFPINRSSNKRADLEFSS